MEDAGVVVDPDPAALVADQLEQAVLLEREDDDLVERVAEHERDHEQRRRDEHVRDAAGGYPPAQTPPPEPCGRGGGVCD